MGRYVEETDPLIEELQRRWMAFDFQLRESFFCVPSVVLGDDIVQWPAQICNVMLLEIND